MQDFKNRRKGVKTAHATHNERGHVRGSGGGARPSTPDKRFWGGGRAREPQAPEEKSSFLRAWRYRFAVLFRCGRRARRAPPERSRHDVTGGLQRSGFRRETEATGDSGQCAAKHGQQRKSGSVDGGVRPRQRVARHADLPAKSGSVAPQRKRRAGGPAFARNAPALSGCKRGAKRGGFKTQAAQPPAERSGTAPRCRYTQERRAYASPRAPCRGALRFRGGQSCGRASAPLLLVLA